MYCKYCGTKLQGNEAHCPYCGAAVTFSNPAPPVPETNQPAEPTAPSRQTPPVQPQPVFPQLGFCSRCGQKLNPGETVCSFCGQAVTDNAQGAPYRPPYVPGQSAGAPHPYYSPQTQPPAEKKGTGTGIAAVVLAVTTIFMNLFGFISIALAITAITQGSKTKNKAAVVSGVISIVLSCILIVVNFIFFDSSGDVY